MLQNRTNHHSKKNLVSVIIPTFNRSEYLKEAINSVYKQSYRPIECILVDDGSTDDTSSVINSFLLLIDCEFQFKYIYQQNAGSQVARNKGTEAATGEYIQYLDSDDLLYPKKLEEQVSYLLKHPECDAVFGDWESGTFESKKIIKGYISQNFIKQMLVLERSIHTSAILFRKELVDLIGLWDVELKRCQEIDFHLRGLLVGGIYHHQSLLTGLWRYHDSERIHNQTGADAFVKFYQKWERILKEQELFTSEMAEIIASWYLWFFSQSKNKDYHKSLTVLEEAVRYNPNLKFYNTFKMRALRILFGRKIALKIWLVRNLQSK
jgi:glycosyltransferase involved in cell wall biosynthesis